MSEELWTMPEWMEPYRECITNTGGNSVEECMNREVNFFANHVVAVLFACVKAQVILLNRLHEEGLLNETPT